MHILVPVHTISCSIFVSQVALALAPLRSPAFFFALFPTREPVCMYTACSPFLATFLYRNNTRKENAGREIRTKWARKIGTRRHGRAREQKRLAPVSFHLTAGFCEHACLGLITRLSSRGKVDCKRSSWHAGNSIGTLSKHNCL